MHAGRHLHGAGPRCHVSAKCPADTSVLAVPCLPVCGCVGVCRRVFDCQMQNGVGLGFL